MQTPKPVSVIVCSRPMVTATALMNLNSVPERAKSEFEAAARRLAIFLHHVKALSAEIDTSRCEFDTQIRRNWADWSTAVRSRQDLQFIAYDDGLGYTSRLYAILYELKAFLDIFARFICRQISGKSPPNGFNKGKLDGTKVSGGSFINWINGHKLDALPHRDELVSLFTKATSEWITEAVEFRDTLVHYRDLPGLLHMRVNLSRHLSTVTDVDILLPQMPSGKDLEAFSIQLRDALCNLVSEVLPLLPNVNKSMNEQWQTAFRYFDEYRIR